MVVKISEIEISQRWIGK